MIRRTILILALLAACLGLIWVHGSNAIARGDLKEPPLPSGLAVKPIALREGGRPTLSGWVSTESGRCGIALLLHGRGSNKAAMAARARLLGQAGFAVAMFDLQGHGGSEGDIRGFGFAEGRDVDRILAFLRGRLPGRRIAAIGTSLGAAALLFADHDKPADAYVLEQLYATLRETAQLRSPLAFARGLQADILLAQMPLRLGYSADDVRPVDRIVLFERPMLLLAGGRDPFVDGGQTRALAQAAPAGTQVIQFDGAGHVDLQRFDDRLYADSVVPFLRERLCPDAG